MPEFIQVKLVWSSGSCWVEFEPGSWRYLGQMGLARIRDFCEARCYDLVINPKFEPVSRTANHHGIPTTQLRPR